MTTQEILSQLEAMGNENTKRVLAKHGAPDNQYGVKIEDLKKIQKVVKKDYTLSLNLYESGNADAQYLAGLIADEKSMTPQDLQLWADTAAWHMISEYTVPWIAAESAHGWDLAHQWINSDKESIRSSGWATLASLVTIKGDDTLDLEGIRSLLKWVEKDIHTSANRVRYVMNNFVMAVGCHVVPLSNEALAIAKTIGPVSVMLGGTACKVPFAPDYIQKVIDRGTVGRKKKMARC